MKHLVSFLVLTTCCALWGVVPIDAQTSVSLYVGQNTILSAPSAPSGAAIYQTAWGCSHASVSVEKYMTTGAKVTVNSYFTGSASVRCDYYYHWYDARGTMYTKSATTYYTITCKAVTLTTRPSSMQLNIGEGQSISCSYSPSNVSPAPKIRYLSSNTNVVTVSSNGYVRAVGSGKATVTIENNMGPNETCIVNVAAVEPTSVSLPSSEIVSIGKSVLLSPTVTPSSAVSTYQWKILSSSAEGVASVNSDGRVYGYKEGTAVVQVTTVNNLTATCTITVMDPNKITSLSLPASQSVGQGNTITLKPTFSPSSASPSLTWISDDPSIASVNGGVVKGEKIGTTTIKVKTANGLSATCKITVTKHISDEVLQEAYDKALNLINKSFKYKK